MHDQVGTILADCTLHMFEAAAQGDIVTDARSLPCIHSSLRRSRRLAYREEAAPLVVRLELNGAQDCQRSVHGQHALLHL